MFKKNAFERMFIELDDSDKQFFITKWNDQGIRKGARVNVDADYVAVFIDRGTVVGVLQPGKHVLETGPNPVTGLIVNAITEGCLYDMELFFVSTRERTSTPFGEFGKLSVFGWVSRKTQIRLRERLSSTY